MKDSEGARFGIKQDIFDSKLDLSILSILRILSWFLEKCQSIYLLLVVSCGFLPVEATCWLHLWHALASICLGLAYDSGLPLSMTLWQRFVYQVSSKELPGIPERP